MNRRRRMTPRGWQRLNRHDAAVGHIALRLLEPKRTSQPRRRVPATHRRSRSTPRRQPPAPQLRSASATLQFDSRLPGYPRVHSSTRVPLESPRRSPGRAVLRAKRQRVRPRPSPICQTGSTCSYTTTASSRRGFESTNLLACSHSRSLAVNGTSKALGRPVRNEHFLRYAGFENFFRAMVENDAAR